MPKLYPVTVRRISGGAGAPTVVLKDDIGFSDSLTLRTTQLDDIGLGDSLILGTTQLDDIGFSDSLTLRTTQLDDTGFSDSLILGITQLDDIGFSDSLTTRTVQLDDIGFQDNAVITATGTPQYIGSPTTATYVGSTVIDVPYPSGILAGDVLLALVSSGDLATSGARTPATPTGWTLVSPGTFIGTATAIAAYSFVRVADGAETGTQPFTYSAGPLNGTGEMHLLRGASATGIVTASAGLLATALNTDPVSPTVSTPVANCLVFAWLVHDHALLSNTHNPPASHLERTDFQAASAGNSLLGSTSATRVFGAAGATGTATHDCGETVSTDAFMQRIAIRPATFTITL